MPQMVHPRMCGAAHHHDPPRKLILVVYLHMCGGELHRIFTTPLHGVATPGHKPTSAKMRGLVCVYQALGGGGCCEGCGGGARCRPLVAGVRWGVLSAAVPSAVAPKMFAPSRIAVAISGCQRAMRGAIARAVGRGGGGGGGGGRGGGGEGGEFLFSRL